MTQWSAGPAAEFFVARFRRTVSSLRRASASVAQASSAERSAVFRSRSRSCCSMELEDGEAGVHLAMSLMSRDIPPVYCVDVLEQSPCP